MKRPKLLELLLSLDESELEAFEQFLNSPFFGKSEARFFELLDVFRVIKNKEEYLPEKLYKNIYAQLNARSTIKTSTFFNISSRLNQKLKEFLSHVALKKHPNQSSLLLTKALSQKNYDLFKLETERVIKHIENQKQYHSSQDLYLLHQLHENYWFHIETPQHQLNAAPFEKSIYYLDHFFIQSKLFYYSEVQNRSNKLNESFPFHFHEVLQKHLTNLSQNKTTTLGHLYSKIEQLLTYQKEQLFFELKEELIEKFEFIQSTIFLDLILFLIHYAQIQVFKGHFQFHKEGLKLYKFLFHKKILPLNGVIRPTEFISVLYLAYEQGETDWAESFFNKYKDHIPLSIIDEVMPFIIVFNKSLKGDLVDFPNFDFFPKIGEPLLYYPRFRILYIKIILKKYDLSIPEQYKLLTSCIDAFSKWLGRKNKRLDNNIRISCKNFCKYIKSIANIHRKKIVIYKYKHDEIYSNVNQLKEKILLEKQLAQKQWLLKLVDDLLKTTPPPK